MKHWIIFVVYHLCQLDKRLKHYALEYMETTYIPEAVSFLISGRWQR
jgi:hypothetical protein